MAKPSKIAILLLAIILAGCAAGSGKNAIDIIAKDEHYALVRLHGGQSFAEVAEALLGHPLDAWQLTEVNAATDPGTGEIVAVPLQPINRSSVYSNGYRTLPILCYHQFTAAAEASQRLEVTAGQFAAQMDYLLANNYRILSFSSIDHILRQGQPIPENAIVITIDDGYQSIYEVAWPILKARSIPATLFVYTDFVGASKALTWAQMREMRRSGLIDIESHGSSHTSLSYGPEEFDGEPYRQRVHEELNKSRSLLKRHLGIETVYLSYPYGDSNDVIDEILRQHHYRLAATVRRGNNTSFSNPFYLNRTMIYSGHDLADFARITRNYRRQTLQ